MTGILAHVVVYKDGLVYAEGDTDPDGAFSASLAPGTYEIHVQKDGYSDIVKTVTLTETEELVVNFTSPYVPNTVSQESILEVVVVYLWPPYGGMQDHGNLTVSGFSEFWEASLICTKNPTISATLSESVSVHK